MYPRPDLRVEGVKAPSDVAEQPLGQIAIDGALNRLRHGMSIEPDRQAWFSIENGLFRVVQPGALLEPRDRQSEDIIQFTEGADLWAEFDPEAAYEDRAVAAIRIPGFPTIVQVSHASEAVPFPREAVLAAFQADGSLAKHTAGSKLAENGIVRDKQNPHIELTVSRPGGPLSRQDQMVRAIIRGLVRLSADRQ